MKTRLLGAVCAFILCIQQYSVAVADTIQIDDNYASPVLLTSTFHNLSNKFSGQFDMAAALGVTPAELGNYTIIGGSVLFSFVDDFDGTYSHSFLGDYSLVGQDDQGRNIYERNYTQYYNWDDEDDLGGVFLPNQFEATDISTGYPDDDFRNMDMGLSQDYPDPQWPLFDPNGLYYTHSFVYQPGTHTGRVNIELPLNSENIISLSTLGILDYYAYMTGVYSYPEVLIHSDIILESATLSVELTQVPLPPSFLFLVSGLLGLIGISRRKKTV